MQSKKKVEKAHRTKAVRVQWLVYRDSLAKVAGILQVNTTAESPVGEFAV
jgi:hypothetical protein